MNEEVVQNQEIKINFQKNSQEMEVKRNQITKVLHMVGNLIIKITPGDSMVIIQGLTMAILTITTTIKILYENL